MEKIKNLEGEIWKPVKGFEGRYEVSNYGRIKSFVAHFGHKTIIMKLKLNRYGYHEIGIRNKEGIKKYKTVHRIVLEAFRGKSILQTDHIDNNRINNKLENLRYLTCRENVSRIHNPKTLGVQKTKFAYTASIKYNKKKYHLGSFRTLKDARNKYIEALDHINKNTFYDYIVRFKREKK